LQFSSNVVERKSLLGVNHRRDAAGRGVSQIFFVERPEQQNRFADTGVAQRHGFVKLHHCEAEDFVSRLEEMCDVCDPCAVAVVLDHREDRASVDMTGNFLNIVAQIFAMDFHPGIEGGILRQR